MPAIDQIPGFEGLEGHSHIPFFFADNFDFAARPVTGNYQYRISLLDTAGNGYQIVAPFEVVSEPSSWVIIVSGCLALGGLAVHRQRVATARERPLLAIRKKYPSRGLRRKLVFG